MPNRETKNSGHLIVTPTTYFLECTINRETVGIFHSSPLCNKSGESQKDGWIVPVGIKFRSKVAYSVLFKGGGERILQHLASLE